MSTTLLKHKACLISFASSISFAKHHTRKVTDAQYGPVIERKRESPAPLNFPVFPPLTLVVASIFMLSGSEWTRIHAQR